MARQCCTSWRAAEPVIHFDSPDAIAVRVAGKGVQILENAGIEVEVGICEDLASKLNQGFLNLGAQPNR
jgi:pyrimidine deaminase RibD-like protein